MPSEKRARKRASREAKMAALEKQRRRRASIRRTITLVVLAGIAIGIYFAVSSGKKTTSSSKASGDTQAALDAVSVKAGCPSSTSQNLNTLPTSDPASHKDLTWSAPPATTIDTSKDYVAEVKTDVGTFDITLDPSDSVAGVNNFVFLAEHGFYDCVIFHRVIPGFVVQGGDPTGTGAGGPGYEFTASGPPKAANPDQQYALGAVAMANSNSPSTTTPTTNGSQFFIVTGTEGESLPPDYVLLGQVTSGMSVVNKINDDGSTSGVPPKITHRMLKVTISST